MVRDLFSHKRLDGVGELLVSEGGRPAGGLLASDYVINRWTLTICLVVYSEENMVLDPCQRSD